MSVLPIYSRIQVSGIEDRIFCVKGYAKRSEGEPQADAAYEFCYAEDTEFLVCEGLERRLVKPRDAILVDAVPGVERYIRDLNREYLRSVGRPVGQVSLLEAGPPEEKPHLRLRRPR